MVLSFAKNAGYKRGIGFKQDTLFFCAYDENIDRTVLVCTANDFEKRITAETLYESYEFANQLSNINQLSKLIESLKDVAGNKNAK